MTSGIRANRRVVFQGLGSLGVAAALAGCGDNGGGDAPDVESGTALTTVAEVPVGGGVILADLKIVVTQPTEGEFKAFTAICTHQACVVSKVAGGTITCACHGSEYDAATGEVTGGPAPSALAEIAIIVEGDEILTA